MMVTCLLIDDEPPGRRLIREYLTDYPNVQIVGEAGGGRTGLEMVQSMQPDLLFLDIQMPGLNGFELLQRLPHPPCIIFTTAYDRYALDAFEVNAVDYLLKPFDRERFAAAMERVPARLSQRGDLAALDGLLRRLAPQTPFVKRMLVKSGHRIVPVDLADVIRLEASGDYTTLVTRDGEYLTSQRLSTLDAQLDPATFIRIHRSTFINVNFLQHLEKDGNGGMLAAMADNTVKRVSRSYAEKLRHWMS